MPRCCMCHEDKPEEAFAFRSLATGKRQSHCRACHAIYRRAHYLRNRDAYIRREVARIEERRGQNRALLLAYLAAHPCVDCGEADPVVLEFDHREPTTKSGSVTVLALSRTWKRVLVEIQKCDVRCVTCHRRRTATQFAWSKLRLVDRALVTTDVRAVESVPMGTGEMRTCRACFAELPISEFSIRNKRTGRRSRTCRGCVAARSRQHYRENADAYLARNRRRDRRRERDARKLLLIRYLLGHPCVDCGETDVLVLEFDHRDPSTKVDSVGAMLAHGTRQQLMEEIAKCDVRCVRCHRIKTAKHFGWSRLGEDATMYVFAGVA